MSSIDITVDHAEGVDISLAGTHVSGDVAGSSLTPIDARHFGGARARCTRRGEIRCVPDESETPHGAPINDVVISNEQLNKAQKSQCNWPETSAVRSGLGAR